MYRTRTVFNEYIKTTALDINLFRLLFTEIIFSARRVYPFPSLGSYRPVEVSNPPSNMSETFLIICPPFGSDNIWRAFKLYILSQYRFPLKQVTPVCRSCTYYNLHEREMCLLLLVVSSTKTVGILRLKTNNLVFE